jgi:SAM-dependent methyltransferase
VLKARHFVHPVQSARSAYWRTKRRRRLLAAAFKQRRDYRHIRRGVRDACWCGGSLTPFTWHENFGICANCGTYVNKRPPLQDDLERLYSLDLYWRRRQELKGFPTIERRAQLYREDGRLEKWLALVDQYAANSGSAVEIGCAPGVLLEELTERGYDCVGVEISEPVAAWMRQTLSLDVRSGFFPGGVELPMCEVFLTFDVLEHSPCPDRFLSEAARLLNPGGVAIIQTAIDRYDFEPPFGERFDMFDDLEHLFLFTDRAMDLMAEWAGLQVVSLDERVWLAGEIAIMAKPAS